MKTQPLYRYLSLAALISIWGCSSSRQMAQNSSDADDLYGISASSDVYASNRQSEPYEGLQPTRRSQRSLRNANPDYVDEQQANGTSNTDEYYAELSARKLNRGLSPDPGWGDDSYNAGFVNGYNAASTSAYSWNRWGFNNTGFYSGLGLGMGMGALGYYGSPGFSFGFGSPFYSPYYGGAYAYSPFYSPFGYGSYYDPFYSSYAYGGYYSPFYSSYYGYGGFYNPVYVNNVYVTGADPYRNRSYIRSNDRSSGRYTSAFDNSTRTYNPNGGRSSYDAASTAASSSNSGYYARPSTSSRGSSYYYDNGASGSGRSGNTVSGTVPSYNSSSNGNYYARPRDNSRGSYTPSGNSYSNGNSGVRGSFSQPSYQHSQPSYQQQSQSFQNNRGSFSQPSFSQPSHSYSAPSSGGSSGFSSGGGHSVGGGGRGPR